MRWRRTCGHNESGTMSSAPPPATATATAATATAKAETAQLTAQLLSDRDFLAYLNKDIVRQALDHWTGVARLPQEEADDLFGDNYAVAQVFGKIRNLQEACNRSGQPMPYRQLMDAANALNSGAPDARGAQSLRATNLGAPPPLAKTPEPILHSRLASPRAAKPVLGKQVSFAESPMEFAVKPMSPSDEEAVAVELPWIFSLNFANITNWWLAQTSLLGVILAVMQARH